MGVQSNVSGTGVDGKSYNIAQQPLFFVRSGLLNPNGPGLSTTGYQAYYWSSTPHSNGTNAYNLNFNNSGVNPSNNNDRLNGFSLRCLARALPIFTPHQTASLALPVFSVISQNQNRHHPCPKSPLSKHALSLVILKPPLPAPFPSPTVLKTPTLC